MKKALLPFQNVKFNVWLFAALAMASILGTLIPQMPENPDRVREFIAHSPIWGALFGRLDLFNIYYSWWFVSLLGLLAFDVIVCKLVFGKFPGFHSFRKKEKDPSAIATQPFQSEWKAAGSVDDASRRIGKKFRRAGYALEVKNLSDGSYLILAVRHRLQRYGSWVSHISILVILLANLTGALYGFREVLNIPEGTSARMTQRPWVVTCDNFIVDWYAGTSTPKTFASDLRLFDRGNLAQERRILVNEPMEHEKVRFYQASYGPYLKEARVGFFLRNDPENSPTVHLRLDEDVPVPGTPYTLRILEFLPDFSLNEKEEIVNRSVHPKNPAIQILVSENGRAIKAPWILENFPTVQMPPIQPTDKFILVLAEYVPSYYTGLQVTYDPGADLFWLGCTILVLGLAALFYFHQRRFWVHLSKERRGRTIRVRVGASSSRGLTFENDFNDLVERLRAETQET